MAELEWEGEPQRPTLRRATRHRLRRFDPTVRVVAEGFLAESSPVDLLAVGGEGEIVSIRIGQRGEDIALFTQCLSDLAWLRPRLSDFLKLAPGLGLEPSAAPRAMLLCPEFAPETRLAASHLPSRTIELLTYRCLRERGQLCILLDAAPASTSASRVETRPTPSPTSGAGLGTTAGESRGSPTGRAAPPEPERRGFRTGLRDEDLRRNDLEEDKTLV